MQRDLALSADQVVRGGADHLNRHSTPSDESEPPKRIMSVVFSAFIVFQRLSHVSSPIAASRALCALVDATTPDQAPGERPCG